MEKGFKQFLTKTSIFILLFILFSIIIGSQLYQYGLLENWKIAIYGRIGYILLFSIAGFILLYKDKLTKFKAYKITKTDIFALFCSLAFLILFYLFEVNAYRFEISLFKIILVHLIGIGIFAFLVLGIYGIDFIRDFIKKFKKEIIYFLGFGILAYSFMNLVWSLWPYFSKAVLKIVYFLLGLISNNVEVIGTDILRYGDFAVKIAEACSGIYSIFIFTIIYIFIVFLDWNKLNHRKVAWIFVPAVIGAFLVNVLRVFVLMIVGRYISKTIALGLYHSYAGMIFFLIYFFVFWKLSYNWMKNDFKSKKVLIRK